MKGLFARFRPSRRTVRVAFAVLVVASVVPTLGSLLSVATGGDTYDGGVPESVPPTDGYTVVTGDGIGPGVIAAYAPNGTQVYYADELRFYHDVDPAPRFGEASVTYVASESASARHCAADDSCRKSKVMRLNVTTGEREELWSRYATPSGSNNVHDVDFVNETHFIVAEISYPDGVYMVNASADEEVWRWNASEHYDPESNGGAYPGDWTHLNDVEYIPERGLVMASPRNMDSVIFLRPGEGVVENLTIGSDDDHRTLYEAHNPDYIPAERGGPAVVVADSENSRIVEYQRDDGDWEQSWLWRDGSMNWPRDADRFPNDHTLITDTHSDRVVEVNADGDIVWKMRFPGPYEAERLGTGSESAGGQAAAASGIESRTADGGFAVDDLLPSLVLHGLLFTLPKWVTPGDAVALLYGALFGVSWVGFESTTVLWRRYASSRAADSDVDGRASTQDD